MASDLLEFLMERYGAREWLEPQAERVVRKVRPRVLMAGMRPLRVQEIEVPAERADVAGLSRELKHAQRSPMRMTDSIWTADDGKDDRRRLVHLRTFECESVVAARAQLLQLLADVQGPTVERRGVAGDVAFAAPGNTFIAGVRWNIVFLLANAGKELMDLSRVAASIVERLEELHPSGNA